MVSACVGVWGGVRGFGQIEIENGNGRECLGKKVKTKREIEDRIKKKEGMRGDDNVLMCCTIVFC